MLTFHESTLEIERLIMDDSFSNHTAETLEFHLSMCEWYYTNTFVHVDPLACNKLIFLRQAVSLYRALVPVVVVVEPAPVRRRPNLPRAPLRELTNVRLVHGIASRKNKDRREDVVVVEVRKRSRALSM
jgi:hypothetical protein